VHRAAPGSTVATAHVATGALVLAASLVLSLASRRLATATGKLAAGLQRLEPRQAL
jgi:hypothetical protein